MNQIAAETGLPLTTKGFLHDRVFVSYREVSTVRILDLVARAVGGEWHREGDSWTLVLSKSKSPVLPPAAWRDLAAKTSAIPDGRAFDKRLNSIQTEIAILKSERPAGWTSRLQVLDENLTDLESIGSARNFELLHRIRRQRPAGDGVWDLPDGMFAYDSPRGLILVSDKGVEPLISNDLEPPTEQVPAGFGLETWDQIQRLTGTFQARDLEGWYKGLASAHSGPIVGDFAHLPLRTLAKDGKSLAESARPLLWPNNKDGGFVFRLQQRGALRTTEPSDETLKHLVARPLTLGTLGSFFGALTQNKPWAAHIRPISSGYAFEGLSPDLWKLAPLLQLPIGVLQRLDAGDAVPLAELSRPVRAELFRLVNGEVYGATTVTAASLFGPSEKPAFLYLERLAPKITGSMTEYTLYLGYGPRDARTLSFSLP